LAGWKLFSQGGQWFTFPSVTLRPGETLSIHTGPQAESSNPASKKLIWSNKYTWNNKGDKAILYDAQGNVVDVYEY
jgi:micrococcal nuclease